MNVERQMSNFEVKMIGILVVILLIPVLGFSQTDSKAYIVKIAPYSLFWGTGEYEIGCEFLTDKRWSLQTDITFSLSPTFPADQPITLRKKVGFNLHPELRYYLFKSKQGPYLANELFCIVQEYEKGNSFLKDFETRDTFFAYERISRNEFGNRFKIGCQFVILKTVAIDTFCGLGIAYRNSFYKTKVDAEICCPVMHFENILGSIVGKGIRGSLDAGIRLGIRIAE